MPAGVTTLYFEAETRDSLRRVGDWRGEESRPQIIVGLLVDRAGFPLRIVVEQFRQAAKVEPLVVVAGRRHAVNRQPERPR